MKTYSMKNKILVRETVERSPHILGDDRMLEEPLFDYSNIEERKDLLNSPFLFCF